MSALGIGVTSNEPTTAWAQLYQARFRPQIDVEIELAKAEADYRYSWFCQVVDIDRELAAQALAEYEAAEAQVQVLIKRRDCPHKTVDMAGYFNGPDDDTVRPSCRDCGMEL